MEDQRKGTKRIFCIRPVCDRSCQAASPWDSVFSKACFRWSPLKPLRSRREAIEFFRQDGGSSRAFGSYSDDGIGRRIGAYSRSSRNRETQRRDTSADGTRDPVWSVVIDSTEYGSSASGISEIWGGPLRHKYLSFWVGCPHVIDRNALSLVVQTAFQLWNVQ